MTSAQASSEFGSTIEPTSSMPIFKRLYLVIYKTLALTFFSTAGRMLRSLCKIPGWSRQVFLSKSTKFESTDFASVMTDDVGCISVPGANIWHFNNGIMFWIHDIGGFSIYTPNFFAGFISGCMFTVTNKRSMQWGQGEAWSRYLFSQ